MLCHSANETYSRPNVRNISWNADICCVCGDAGGRFRDGRGTVEESYLETGIGDDELIDRSGGDGSHWVREFLF